MKRVIFFITSLDSGGVENYLLRFIENKGKEFSDIVVFCKSGKGGELEKKLLSFENVTLIKQKFDILNPFHYLRIINKLKSFKHYSICDFTGNFAAPIILCSYLVGVKNRIAFYRESRNQFLPSKFKEFLANMFSIIVEKLSTIILSNSFSALDHFYSKGWQEDRRFNVVYNGLDLDNFYNTSNNRNIRDLYNIPSDAHLIGHIGRFTAAKNHMTILKVFGEIISSSTDEKFYLILCGNGVTNYINSLGLEYRKYIITIDFTLDIASILKSINCFYFPSLNEGQPNALIEAMGLGVPFVASNIDSIKEIVPKELYNYLVTPSDVLNAKRKILDVLYNGYRYQNFTKDYVRENFDANKQFEKFNKFL